MRITRVLCAAAAALLLGASAASSGEAKAPVVEDGKQISIEYTLTLDDGTEADTNVGGQPLVYTHGGGQILPALESQLTGLGVNETKHVELSAEQGYGEVDPKAFQKVEPSLVPEDARKVGTVLMAQGPQGQRVPVRVSEISDEEITLDLNHPLAGRGLIFDVKILSIEDAPAAP